MLKNITKCKIIFGKLIKKFFYILLLNSNVSIVEFILYYKN